MDKKHERRMLHREDSNGNREYLGDFSSNSEKKALIEKDKFRRKALGLN